MVAAIGNLSTKVSANPSAVGLSTLQAASLASLYQDFVSARDVTLDPLTRSPANLALKSQKKALMLAEVRTLVAIIQACPAVNNAVRVDLGLPQRDTNPTPRPAPQVSPVGRVLSMNGHVMTYTLYHGKRPVNCDGATILTYVGESAPANTALWSFAFNTTRPTVEITFPATLAPGTRVFVTSFFYGSRAESGPACQPAAAWIGFGGVNQAA